MCGLTCISKEVRNNILVSRDSFYYHFSISKDWWHILYSNLWGVYMAGHLSLKSDIYSLGVVLLELLSGKRALDEDNRSTEKTLVDWAKPFLNDKRKMLRIMDTRLEGQYSKKEAQTIVALVLQCLHADPRNRPNMRDILPALEQLRAPKDTPRMYSRA